MVLFFLKNNSLEIIKKINVFFKFDKLLVYMWYLIFEIWNI